MSRIIPLTRGKVTVVDDADYAFLTEYSWHCTASGYAATRIKGVYWYMQRLLIDAPKNRYVDHIDGDRLNNTRSNLRIVTNSQNQMNRKRQANRSGYKGVCWHAYKDKWQVRIQKDGKNHFVGYFDDAKEAALAYDEAARRLHGEYARPNFPDSVRNRLDSVPDEG